MDIGALLKSLNDHGVKYVIIGAAAFPVHGWSRTTHDIDIFIEATPNNAKRVHQALLDFGYDLSDVTPEDLLQNKVLLRQYILETDIHPFVAGASFAAVWKDRVKEKLFGVPTQFASLGALIRMKRAANRPKDREDLKQLLEIRKIVHSQK